MRSFGGPCPTAGHIYFCAGFIQDQHALKINPDNFASWAYDALNIIALAIANAKSTEPEAIRTAILSIKGYQGLEGTYVFDKNGDGLHGYNVVKNEDGKIAFVKRVDFLPE